MKKARELGRFSKLHQAKYLNNLGEQTIARSNAWPNRDSALELRHDSAYPRQPRGRSGGAQEQVSAVPADNMAAQRTFAIALFGAAA